MERFQKITRILADKATPGLYAMGIRAAQGLTLESQYQ